MKDAEKKKLIAMIERTNSAVDILRLKPQILEALGNKPKSTEEGV